MQCGAKRCIVEKSKCCPGVTGFKYVLCRGRSVDVVNLFVAAVVFPELQLTSRNSSKSLFLKLLGSLENWNDTIEVEFRKSPPETSSEQYEDSDSDEQLEGSAIEEEFPKIHPWLSFEAEIEIESDGIEIKPLLPNTVYEVRIKAGKFQSTVMVAKTAEDGRFQFC